MRELAAVDAATSTNAHYGSLALKAIHIAVIQAASGEPRSAEDLAERAGYPGGNGKRAVTDLANAGVLKRHKPSGFSIKL